MQMDNLLVFASHSSDDRRESGNRNSLEKFIAQVESVVRTKLGLPSEQDIVFLDARNIEVGDAWEDKLLQAVSRARSILCLLSPNYLRSDWCGRELQVFLKRIEQLREQPDSDFQSFIFPVFWEGQHPPYDLPEVICRFQFRLTDVPAEYGRRGLAWFYRTKKSRQVARICESVADAVASAFSRRKGGIPPVDEALSLAELQSAFQTAVATPAFPVRLLMSQGWHSMWWHELGSTVRELFGDATEYVPADLASPSADLLTRFCDGATEHPLFCLLTVAEENALRDLLEKVIWPDTSKSVFPFVLTKPESDAVEDESKEALWRALGIERVAADSAGGFGRKLRSRVVEIRSRMISAAEGCPATDSELEAAASNDGIRVEIKPFLSASRRAGREQ